MCPDVSSQEVAIEEGRALLLAPSTAQRVIPDTDALIQGAFGRNAAVTPQRRTRMKTPTTDDEKPKRDNLGPTGPAKVSGDEDKNSGQADGSYEKDLER